VYNTTTIRLGQIRNLAKNRLGGIGREFIRKLSGEGYEQTCIPFKRLKDYGLELTLDECLHVSDGK